MNKKIDINFNWKYSPDFKEEYIEKDFDSKDFIGVDIPHTNIEVPYNNFDEKMYQFESCYRKKLWIEKPGPNEDVYIKFNAVMAHAKVYLNGDFIGEHRGGYTPFKLKLTKALIPNEDNYLCVYVDSREKEDIPPFGFVIDYLTYGGIYREVSLEYKNKIHFEKVAIKTEDNLTKSPKLVLDLHYHNESEKNQDLICKFDLLKEGRSIHKFERKLNFTSSLKDKITVKESLKDIKLWSLDNPHLYHLKVNLIKDEMVIDENLERFGFREIEFTGHGFYLNGEKIKLRGLNRHQSFPYVGYAMPKSAQRKDADILKDDLGVNIVRLSHYPQSDHFLDRCDEIGLLAFDEIPGWQHIGDKTWQDISVKNVKEMILKDINHPSVIIWGVRINESKDMDSFYKRTNKAAKDLDNSRPTGGVRNMANSSLLEDVYTYNDFVHMGNNRGLEEKKKITSKDTPYLITEYNGHMFPTKKFDPERRRVEHALRHLNVVEAMEESSYISGSIGWCMFDYNTHKDFGSGDKICHHGVMDMFRIPKYAAFAYQSQSNSKPVMHVASSFNIGEYDALFIDDIYVFTNCDYVDLYKNDDFVSTFYPNKEKYPNLLFPPVIIDDLIGDGIKENEIFSPKDADTIKSLLLNVQKTGLDLSLSDKLKMGKIFLKYKLNMSDAEDLYTKYLGGWGDKATTYYFKGYKDGICTNEAVKSQVSNPKLSVKVDEKVLIEDVTYDTTRITINLLDQNNNDIIYANDTFTLEAMGPLEIIGPKIISLIGGSIGFWVKTKGESGEGRIIIKSERFGVKEEKIKVIKK